MRRIAVLDAPSNLGLRPPTATSVPGCAKAPGALRDHDLLGRLAARDAGCLAYLGFPQALGAEVDFRRGRWGDGLSRAHEAVRSLEETGQASPLAFALATLAQLEAGIGREEACLAHAERAMEIADELGLGSIRVYRACALALLAQGLGRPEAVLELLEPIAPYAAESGLGEPATVLGAVNGLQIPRERLALG